MGRTGKTQPAPTARFSFAPIWKWAVAIVLFICAGLLAFWKPSVRVELLPISNIRPTWDGSYPYLVITEIRRGSKPVQFGVSVFPLKPTVHHDSAINEFEVDLHSGEFILRQTDLFVSDLMPLSLTRTYTTWTPRWWDSRAGEFGNGASYPYDICPTGTRNPYTHMDLNLEDGRPIRFNRISRGSGFANAVFRHDATSSEFYDARIAWNGNGWTLSFPDGRQILFPEAYYAKNFAQGAPTEIQDAAGHRIRLVRDQVRKLQKLVSPAGRSISFTYDAANRIAEATDDAGNVRKYSYDPSGNLETVANASQVLFRFEYARLVHDDRYDPYLMTAVIDGRGTVLLRNTYDRNGRISEQALANGDAYRYEYMGYLFGRNYEIVETIVTGPTGTKRFFFRRGILIRQE